MVELHATERGRHLYDDLGFFVKTDNIAMQALRGEAAKERIAPTKAQRRRG